MYNEHNPSPDHSGGKPPLPPYRSMYDASFYGGYTGQTPQVQPQPQPQYNPVYQSAPGRQKNGKKRGKAPKWIAAALACVLLGAGGGVLGGAAGDLFLKDTTAIQVSGRAVPEVKQMKVDGQTLMTNAENYAANVGAVVSINVGTEINYFGRTVEQPSSGSGFILTADGYILTNYHVVENASTIQVTTYDGQTYPASYIGGDEQYDIAVVKVEAQSLQSVVIGDSEGVNVGDDVIAIGNPLGELTFSMTSGSVSSANRAITVEGTPFNMIQVDCAINPGNSGGPLLNSYGEVIGIVSAKYSTYASTTVEGLGFAIPINDVYAMVKDIMENGYVTNKAYLGINPGTVTVQMQMQYNLPAGVFVYNIEPDSAAAKCGMQAGDVIVALDDTAIASAEDLFNAKKKYRGGDHAKITVNRGGTELTLDLTFDAQPQDEAAASSAQDAAPGNGYDPYSGYDLFDYFYGGGNNSDRSSNAA